MVQRVHPAGHAVLASMLLLPAVPLQIVEMDLQFQGTQIQKSLLQWLDPPRDPGVHHRGTGDSFSFQSLNPLD